MYKIPHKTTCLTTPQHLCSNSPALDPHVFEQRHGKFAVSSPQPFYLASCSMMQMCFVVYTRPGRVATELLTQVQAGGLPCSAAPEPRARTGGGAVRVARVLEQLRGAPQHALAAGRLQLLRQRHHVPQRRIGLLQAAHFWRNVPAPVGRFSGCGCALCLLHQRCRLWCIVLARVLLKLRLQRPPPLQRRKALLQSACPSENGAAHGHQQAVLTVSPASLQSRSARPAQLVALRQAVPDLSPCAPCTSSYLTQAA